MKLVKGDRVRLVPTLAGVGLKDGTVERVDEHWGDVMVEFDNGGLSYFYESELVKIDADA